MSSKSKGTKRVILVDGSSLIYRAFFAIPGSFQTSDGVPTNATYGFATMFRKILRGKKPDFGAVVFDAPGKTFRDEAYPEYKAQRPSMPGDLRSQIPWIHKLVEAHDWPLFHVKGFEADDVIGTLAIQAKKLGHEVHIIAGDKDYAQLIGDGVRMVDTMRDVTYDPELVRKKWGVPPEQFIDYLALMGDKVDNIPGVPGVGQKTAAKLLKEHGNLEAILGATESMKGKLKERLENHAEDARMSQRLATIDINVKLDRKLEDLVVPDIDEAKVNTLYRELQFFSLLSEGEREAEAQADGDFALLDPGKDEADLIAFLEGITGQAAVYALTDPGSTFLQSLIGVAVAPEAGKARYIETKEGVPAALKAFLEDEAKEKIAHDVRDVFALMSRADITLRGVQADTALASFLIDPTGNIPHRLDQVVRAFVHRTSPDAKSIVGSGKSQVSFADVEQDKVAGYACLLASNIHEAWQKVSERLDEEEQNKNLSDVSLPLAEVLASMQVSGVRCDPEILGGLQEDFAKRKLEIEKKIYEQAGREFNIGSTKQLGTVLFDELELPVLKRTKTGYSTAADVLQRLAPKHPIASMVLSQRALAKLINTYTRVLREAIQEDGRVHCTFQQTAGASGRLITTEPDLQRTPIRTEDGKRIREAFIPRDGWVMLSADWSQIELRVLAHVSGDPLLVEAFEKDLDIHSRTASQLFDIAPEDVDKEQRNVGKTVNFATIYGQGATALGQGLGIPRKQAKAYIDRYFERYAGVRTWLDETVEQAYKDRFVTTILGRRRYVTELSSNNNSDRAYGERIATNTPIQGSAADICKLAMLRIHRELSERSMKTKMLLQIHDELIFEAPPEEEKAALELIRTAMETVWPMKVPLKVDIGSGASWAAAH